MRAGLKKKHLNAEQERQVQRQEGNEPSYFQSCEKRSGWFVSSYTLRVICLLQLYHPAVTRCCAPLLSWHPGTWLPLPTIISPCAYSTFVRLYAYRLLARERTGSGYLCSLHQFELSPSVGLVTITHTRAIGHLTNQNVCCTMQVSFSRRPWNVSGVIPRGSHAASLDTRPICRPHTNSAG